MSGPGASSDWHDGCYCYRDSEVEAARAAGLPIRCGGGLPCMCLGPASFPTADFPDLPSPLPSPDIDPSYWDAVLDSFPINPASVASSAQPAHSSPIVAASTGAQKRPRPAPPSGPSCQCPCAAMHRAAAVAAKQRKCCGGSCSCPPGLCRCPQTAVPTSFPCCPNPADLVADSVAAALSITDNASRPCCSHPPQNQDSNPQIDRLFTTPAPVHQKPFLQHQQTRTPTFSATQPTSAGCCGSTPAVPEPVLEPRPTQQMPQPFFSQPPLSLIQPPPPPSSSLMSVQANCGGPSTLIPSTALSHPMPAFLPTSQRPLPAAQPQLTSHLPMQPHIQTKYCPTSTPPPSSALSQSTAAYLGISQHLQATTHGQMPSTGEPIQSQDQHRYRAAPASLPSSAITQSMPAYLPATQDLQATTHQLQQPQLQRQQQRPLEAYQSSGVLCSSCAVPVNTDAGSLPIAVKTASSVPMQPYSTSSALSLAQQQTQVIPCDSAIEVPNAQQKIEPAAIHRNPKVSEGSVHSVAEVSSSTTSSARGRGRRRGGGVVRRSRSDSTRGLNRAKSFPESAGTGSSTSRPSMPEKSEDRSRPFACNICSWTFLFKQNRDRHINEVHVGNRPHKCKHANCDRAFKNRSGLKQHVRTVHEKARPFECSQCDSAFGQRNHLTQHILVVHDKVKMYECEVCNMKFSNVGNRTQHMKRKHAGNAVGVSNGEAYEQEEEEATVAP